jgi:hypothetical protein
MRHGLRESRTLRRGNASQRFGKRANLVPLDQNRVRRTSQLMHASSLDVGNESVITDQLHAIPDSLRQQLQ